MCRLATKITLGVAKASPPPALGDATSSARRLQGLGSSTKQFYDTHHPEQSALTDDLLHFPFAVGEKWRRIFKQVASCPAERGSLLEALRTVRGNCNLSRLKCPVRFDKAQQVVMLWLCSPAGGGFLARLREQHRPGGGQWTRGAEEAVLEAMARVSPTLAERLRVIAWAGCTEEQKAVALEQYLKRLTDPAHLLEVLRLVMKGNKADVEIATSIIKSMPAEAEEAMHIIQATPASLLLTGWRTSSGVAAGINPGLTLLDMFPGELIHALKDAEAANRGREEAAYLCATGLRGAVPGLLPALQQAVARKTTGVALQIAIEMLSRDQGWMLLLGAGVSEVDDVSKFSNELALELLSAQCLPALVADLETKFKPPVRWGTASEEEALSYVKQNISPTLGALMQRTAWEGCTRQHLRAALQVQLEQAEPSVIRCFIVSAPTAEERELRERLVAILERDTLDAVQDLEAALLEPAAEQAATAPTRGPTASGPETDSGQQELPPPGVVGAVGTQVDYDVLGLPSAMSSPVVAAPPELVGPRSAERMQAQSSEVQAQQPGGLGPSVDAPAAAEDAAAALGNGSAFSRTRSGRSSGGGAQRAAASRSHSVRPSSGASGGASSAVQRQRGTGSEGAASDAMEAQPNLSSFGYWRRQIGDAFRVLCELLHSPEYRPLLFELGSLCQAENGLLSRLDGLDMAGLERYRLPSADHDTLAQLVASTVKQLQHKDFEHLWSQIETEAPTLYEHVNNARTAADAAALHDEDEMEQALQQERKFKGLPTAPTVPPPDPVEPQTSAQAADNGATPSTSGLGSSSAPAVAPASARTPGGAFDGVQPPATGGDEMSPRDLYGVLRGDLSTGDHWKGASDSVRARIVWELLASNKFSCAVKLVSLNPIVNNERLQAIARTAGDLDKFVRDLEKLLPGDGESASAASQLIATCVGDLARTLSEVDGEAPGALVVLFREQFPKLYEHALEVDRSSRSPPPPPAYAAEGEYSFDNQQGESLEELKASPSTSALPEAAAPISSASIAQQSSVQGPMSAEGAPPETADELAADAEANNVSADSNDNGDGNGELHSAPMAEERELRSRLVAFRAQDMVNAAQDLEAALLEPQAATAMARGPAASGPATDSGQQELTPPGAVGAVGTQSPDHIVKRTPATSNVSRASAHSFNEEEASLDGSTASGSSSPTPQQELEGDEPQPVGADAACGFPEREPLQLDPLAPAQMQRRVILAMELLAYLEAVERDVHRWTKQHGREMLVILTAELLRSPTWGMPELLATNLFSGLPILRDKEHRSTCLEAAEQTSLAGCRKRLRDRYREDPGPLRSLAVAPAVSLLRYDLQKVLEDGDLQALVERYKDFAFELPTLNQQIRI
ncbi:hypothetical protein GPECTOR_10g842 [Gonium pectorale]|uniref:Uncharacterized protein n=1 Tax=Gonium pectorale TaxID=33097 RepID=A0A150GQX9_GONPE|nr:hypothetical protein GPECTOR_10g842 [Gonium pectorale]|eukprot:KXZ52211.1 hypothetical protein GPECTOR_10g842 [Gonium pectorale]